MDWYYQRSDDHRVYKRGYAKYLELQALCVLGEAYQTLFRDFQRWGLGRGYEDKEGKTVRYPKPKRPDTTNNFK